jgi:hypothetical protein
VKWGLIVLVPKKKSAKADNKNEYDDLLALHQKCTDPGTELNAEVLQQATSNCLG